MVTEPAHWLIFVGPMLLAVLAGALAGRGQPRTGTPVPRDWPLAAAPAILALALQAAALWRAAPLTADLATEARGRGEALVTWILADHGHPSRTWRFLRTLVGADLDLGLTFALSLAAAAATALTVAWAARGRATLPAAAAWTWLAVGHIDVAERVAEGRGHVAFVLAGATLLALGHARQDGRGPTDRWIAAGLGLAALDNPMVLALWPAVLAPGPSDGRRAWVRASLSGLALLAAAAGPALSAAGVHGGAHRPHDGAGALLGVSLPLLLVATLARPRRAAATLALAALVGGVHLAHLRGALPEGRKGYDTTLTLARTEAALTLSRLPGGLPVAAALTWAEAATRRAQGHPLDGAVDRRAAYAGLLRVVDAHVPAAEPVWVAPSYHAVSLADVAGALSRRQPQDALWPNADGEIRLGRWRFWPEGTRDGEPLPTAPLWALTWHDRTPAALASCPEVIRARDAALRRCGGP